MQEAAKEKSLEGWLITLQQPDMMAVLTFAQSSQLREEVQRAYLTVASELSGEGRWDNAPVMQGILRNAYEHAKLLGRSQYAELSLATKMAASVGVDGVRKFIDDLIARARPKALLEFAAMKKFAAEKLGITDFKPWDFLYVYEHMMQDLYAVDQEKVREYFPFEKVISGLATLLERIYGVNMVETQVSVWREGVKFYEVYDAHGVLRGALYADMYAREGKKSGAWMDTLVSSRKLPEGMQIPVAYLNCNASRPTEGGDAYLTHDDVITLFHESGHVFHHLMGLTDHPDLSMNHVEWDTVELPSQFLENWCWDKEMLVLMSEHKVTKETIPDDLIARMLAAKFFNTGLFTLRQLCLGYFDMELYSRYDPATPVDPNVLWKEVASTIEVRPSHPDSRFPNSFGHIFAGGYSAGYFSYMWALGLAADARAVFDEAGDIFSRTVGERFVAEVLAPGSSRPMAESFRRFRGRDLDPDALAIHLGLLAQ
jgi:oligopeptidase A